MYNHEWDVAVVAPLLSNIDLSCLALPEENLAYYYQSDDQRLLYEVKEMIVKETYAKQFCPSSLIVVTWKKVQRFKCPQDKKVTVYGIIVIELIASCIPKACIQYLTFVTSLHPS